MAKTRTPRTAWIDAALKALAAGGPEAVRVEALAEGLGVTKGGFYWHFADRQALLDEMLDVWEQAGTDEVLAAVERHSDDPRQRIQVFFDMAPSADFTVELALRDWARRDRTVADRLRRIDKRRMAFLRSLFMEFCDDEEAETRAMLTYSLLIGSWFVVARSADKLRLLAQSVDHLLA